MEYSIHRNGRYWQTSWTDKDGTRHRRSLGRCDRAEAERRAADVIRQLEIDYENQSQQSNHAPALSGWCIQYLELRQNDLQPATRTLYAQTIRTLVAHVGDATPIDQISRLDARRWYNALECQDQTRRKHARNAKVIFRWAMDYLPRGTLEDNPFAILPSAPQQVDKAWRYITPCEADTIFDACPSDGWRALFGLCRLAGLRRSEALAITWADVDFERRRVHIHHAGATTTKKKSRVVPMATRLNDLLVDAFATAGDGVERVCNIGIAEHNIRYHVLGIIRRAGLAPWSKPLHTLRKNCETDWLGEYPVMDVCAWLGHSPSVAQKHYHQPRPEIMDRAAGVTPVLQK